jgi:hypothetical protein
MWVTKCAVFEDRLINLGCESSIQWVLGSFWTVANAVKTNSRWQQICWWNDNNHLKTAVESNSHSILCIQYITDGGEIGVINQQLS